MSGPTNATRQQQSVLNQNGMQTQHAFSRESSVASAVDSQNGNEQQPSGRGGRTDYLGVQVDDFIKSTLKQNSKARVLLMKLEIIASDFLNDPEKQSLRFIPSASYQRMLIHRVATLFGFEHNIDSTKESVVISKTPRSMAPLNFRFRDFVPPGQEVPTITNAYDIVDTSYNEKAPVCRNFPRASLAISANSTNNGGNAGPSANAGFAPPMGNPAMTQPGCPTGWVNASAAEHQQQQFAAHQSAMRAGGAHSHTSNGVPIAVNGTVPIQMAAGGNQQALYGNVQPQYNQQAVYSQLPNGATFRSSQISNHDSGIHSAPPSTPDTDEQSAANRSGLVHSAIYPNVQNGVQPQTQFITAANGSAPQFAFAGPTGYTVVPGTFQQPNTPAIYAYPPANSGAYPAGACVYPPPQNGGEQLAYPGTPGLAYQQGPQPNVAYPIPMCAPMMQYATMPNGAPRSASGGKMDSMAEAAGGEAMNGVDPTQSDGKMAYGSAFNGYPCAAAVEQLPIGSHVILPFNNTLLCNPDGSPYVHESPEITSRLLQEAEQSYYRQIAAVNQPPPGSAQQQQQFTMQQGGFTAAAQPQQHAAGATQLAYNMQQLSVQERSTASPQRPSSHVAPNSATPNANVNAGSQAQARPNNNNQSQAANTVRSPPLGATQQQPSQTRGSSQQQANAAVSGNAQHRPPFTLQATVVNQCPPSSGGDGAAPYHPPYGNSRPDAPNTHMNVGADGMPIDNSAYQMVGHFAPGPHGMMQPTHLPVGSDMNLMYAAAQQQQQQQSGQFIAQPAGMAYPASFAGHTGDAQAQHVHLNAMMAGAAPNMVNMPPQAQPASGVEQQQQHVNATMCAQPSVGVMLAAGSNPHTLGMQLTAAGHMQQQLSAVAAAQNRNANPRNEQIVQTPGGVMMQRPLNAANLLTTVAQNNGVPQSIMNLQAQFAAAAALQGNVPAATSLLYGKSPLSTVTPMPTNTANVSMPLANWLMLTSAYSPYSAYAYNLARLQAACLPNLLPNANNQAGQTQRATGNNARGRNHSVGTGANRERNAGHGHGPANAHKSASNSISHAEHEDVPANRESNEGTQERDDDSVLEREGEADADRAAPSGVEPGITANMTSSPVGKSLALKGDDNATPASCSPATTVKADPVTADSDADGNQETESEADRTLCEDEATGTGSA